MNALTIADTAIRQDAEGRYCLNDLHRASGAESKHQPAFWLRNAQTRALIEEIGNSANLQSSPVASIEGAGGGTYVAKELVYAYAMWISAAFHLKVIRAYDALVAQPATLAIPQTLPEALRLAAEAIEERDRLALAHKASSEALAIAAPKAQALDRIASPTEGAVCLRVAAKLLQMPEKQFLQFASAEGFIFRNHHSRIWQGYAEKAKAGLVELKLTTIERDDGSTKTVEQVLITRAGIARLAERLERRNRCTTTTQKATTPTTAAPSTRLSTPPSSSMPT